MMHGGSGSTDKEIQAAVNTGTIKIMNSLNGGNTPLSLHQADISNNYGTNSIFQGNSSRSFMGMSSLLQENAACCDYYIAFTLATQTVATVEACHLDERLESLMMERSS